MREQLRRGHLREERVGERDLSLEARGVVAVGGSVEGAQEAVVNDAREGRGRGGRLELFLERPERAKNVVRTQAARLPF